VPADKSYPALLSESLNLLFILKQTFMLNFTKLNLHFLHARTWKPYALGIKMLTGVFLFFGLIVSKTSLSQTGFPTCTKGHGQEFLPHCTSQDLSVSRAFLTGDCFCVSGTTATGTLNFELTNKTGSTRSSFAFFAILVQKDADGNVVSSDYITDCKEPVPGGSVAVISFATPVSYQCGSTLTLTNVYLAWTDASDHKTCPLVFCDIAPKCGAPADIPITPLLTATATPSDACTGSSDGSLTVSASGGVTPYTYSLNGTTYQSSATFTGLSAGSKTVYVKDAASPTPCIYQFSATVGSHACCVAPPKPAVCQTPASLCGGDGTASLTISNAVVGDIYYLVQDAGGATSSATASATTLTFTGLTPGKNFTVYGTDVVNGTTCTGASATCNDLTGVCAANITSKATINPEITESETTVKAYPNPFSDRIKFVVTSPVAGRGNLEVYNMMGQKVKTVYQGFITAGTQTFELSMPKQQISNLVYVLRIGDKKMSGKILQINQ
jgi:hypothetical protein